MSNSNKNKWLAIGFVLLIVLNVTTLTALWMMSKHRPFKSEGEHSGSVNFLAKELGFDSIQKQTLQALLAENREKIRQEREKIRDAKDALFSLLQKPDVTDSMVQQASNVAAMHEQEIDRLTFKAFQRVRNMCQKNQQGKFDNMIIDIIHSFGQPPPPGEGRHQDPPPPPGQDGPPEERERRGPPPLN
jgi:hypothetical protein